MGRTLIIAKCRCGYSQEFMAETERECKKAYHAAGWHNVPLGRFGERWYCKECNKSKWEEGLKELLND